MNIVCIPYHDWRKIEIEGARTRDSHIISHLTKSKEIDITVIVNRPITYTELYLKKKGAKIIGEKIFSHGAATLYKVSEGLYVYDFFSADLLGPILKKKKWFFDSFGDEKFITGFYRSLDFLGIKIDIVYNQNIFASELVKEIGLPSVFDAWDNFILFPENKIFESAFKKAYSDLALTANIWTTNSQKNIEYYMKHYRPSGCVLIKNGVDVERFKKTYKKPRDLEVLEFPIIGFGGKITHLFNYDFFNYAAMMNPDKNFVIVGQILDKDVFDKIEKSNNVFYLGDKPYSEYCAYVTNFDLGIIPYVTDHLEHGADSIKMYEYLASGLNVVGTSGAGMVDLADFIFISSSKEEFAEKIAEALRIKNEVDLPDFHTWKYKTEETLNVFHKILKN